MTIGVIGESLVDVFTDASGKTVERVGGSPFNVAIALARLDMDAHLFTTVGDDPRGDLLLTTLAAEGIEVTLGAAAPSTAVARATLDPAGRATYDFDLTWDPRFGDEWPSFNILHFGSLGAAAQPGANEVRAIVDRYKGKALISYDPNWRAGFGDGALTAFESNAALADIVKLSDEDAASFYPDAELDDVAHKILDLGPALVVITKGGDGAEGWTRETRKRVPAAIAEVVDTVGAGDAFMATVLSEIAEMNRETVEGLSSREIELVLSFGCFVAGKTCERAGADPPHIGDLLYL